MEKVDRFIYKTCPFVAGGIFIGSVYWTAVTYGAVTVMQVSTLSLLNSIATDKVLFSTENYYVPLPFGWGVGGGGDILFLVRILFALALA